MYDLYVPVPAVLTLLGVVVLVVLAASGGDGYAGGVATGEENPPIPRLRRLRNRPRTLPQTAMSRAAGD